VRLDEICHRSGDSLAYSDSESAGGAPVTELVCLHCSKGPGSAGAGAGGGQISSAHGEGAG